MTVILVKIEKGDSVPDYKGLYFKLFAAMADAVEELEQGELFRARERLIRAQQEAEEEYLKEE